MSVRFGVLGPLEVTVGDGTSVALGGPRPSALLAILLLADGETVERDRLAELLWHGRPPASARNALQVHVSGLRRRVAEADGDAVLPLETEATGYRIAVDAGALDLHRFDTLARRGRAALHRGDALEALDDLNAALDLWRGDVLEGLDLHADLAGSLDRIRARRLETTQDRIEAQLALGRHREVVPELAELTRDHPRREAFWAQRMLALYRADRPTEASELFHELRSGLAEEHGLDPSGRLRELHDAILRHDPALHSGSRGRRTPKPAPAPDSPGRSNLPRPTATLVGRDEELAQLTELATERQLVTITGPPGVGKTRLAVETATRVEPCFPDGVWFVQLAGLSSPAWVATTIASTLGFRADQGPTPEGSIARWAEQRTALLVLDNCEHLLAEVRRIVEAVIAASSDIRILATSRRPLGTATETVWRARPLAVPATGATDPAQIRAAAAARLLVERGRQADPDLELTSDNAPIVAELARRTDGLPLVIEVVAARAGALALPDLLERFDTLTAGAEPRSARHEVETALRWSFELLSETERDVLRRLGVFRGSFDLPAVDAVVGDPVGTTPVLAGLVDQGLVARDETTGTSGRYRLLEVIRTFAARELGRSGDEPTVRRRHTDHYHALARRFGRATLHGDQFEALDRLERELDNVRAALEWELTSGDPQEVLRTVSDLYGFWLITARFSEAADWLERADARSAPGQLGAEARAVLGGMRCSVFDVDDGLALVRSAADQAREAGDDWTLAVALMWLASTCHTYLGDNDTAERCALEGLEVTRASGDAWHENWMLANLASIRYRRGDVEGAVDLISDVYLAFRDLDNPYGMNTSAMFLGPAAFASGDLDRAVEALQASQESAAALGDTWGYAYAIAVLADVRLVRGQLDQARRLLQEVATLGREIGQSESVMEAAGRLACVEAEAGDPQRSRRALVDAVELLDPATPTWFLNETLEAIACAMASRDDVTATRLLGATDGIRHAEDQPAEGLYRHYVRERADRLRGRHPEAWEEWRGADVHTVVTRVRRHVLTWVSDAPAGAAGGSGPPPLREHGSGERGGDAVGDDARTTEDDHRVGP